MKNFIILLTACFLCIGLTGCIEITRGYKSQVSIKVEGESTSAYTSNPKLQLSADKDYSDLIRANTDASQNKSETPADPK